MIFATLILRKVKREKSKKGGTDNFQNFGDQKNVASKCVMFLRVILPKKTRIENYLLKMLPFAKNAKFVFKMIKKCSKIGHFQIWLKSCGSAMSKRRSHAFKITQTYFRQKSARNVQILAAKFDISVSKFGSNHDFRPAFKKRMGYSLF